MILNFSDKQTQKLWETEKSTWFGPFARVALRKLIQLNAAERLQLNAAERLEDLRCPPGNRLESLHGEQEGQQSIRINQQWRICFRWQDGSARDVEIVDYH